MYRPISKRGREPQPALQPTTLLLNTMALAAREVQVATGDKHAVAIERKLVVDPQTGRAAHVENVAVAVELDDGTVGVARQQRIHFVQDSGRSTNYSSPEIMCCIIFLFQELFSDLVVWAK